MELSFPQGLILGVTLVGLVVGVVLLLRSLPRGRLSPEERGELAKAPCPVYSGVHGGVWRLVD